MDDREVVHGELPDDHVAGHRHLLRSQRPSPP
jgi:hypothetical protein